MIKFLVIFFSIIYLGGLISRWFLKKWVSNLSQQNGRNEPQNNKKEGDVTINYGAKSNRKMDPNEGEYVEYEDVK